MGGRGSKRKAEDKLTERGGCGQHQLEEEFKTSSGSGGRAPGGGSGGRPGSSRSTADAYSGTGPVPNASRWWEQEVEEEEPERLSSESEFEKEVKVRKELLDVDGSESFGSWSDPFATVPEVVMRDYLLPLLEDPKDRLNLARASPSVAKLLGDSRMTSLYFCLIFQLPNFLDLLRYKELLRLREVSKDWNKSIDSSLDGRVNPSEPNYRSYKSICASPATLALGPGGHQRVRQLQKIHLPNPGSDRLTKLVSDIRAGKASVTPFVLKQASVLICSEVMAADGEPYFDKNLTVLRKFGRDVRYLQSVCFFQADMVRFPEYLNQLPLLTGLNFGLQYLRDGRAPPGVTSPPLPNLALLRLETFEVPLFPPFMVYFDQLVSLDVLYSFAFMEWLDPGTQSTFPNLKHLAVYITGWEQLQSLTGPLADVSIKCQRCASNICPSVHLYFVEQFKGTLSSFKINQDFDCTEPVRTLQTFGLPEQARIDLPSLKTFSFNIKECGYGPVDHLLKLSTPPEYLELCVGKCWNGCQGIRRNDVLQIQARFLKQLYTSNVWTLLPPLKEVQVCGFMGGWKDDHYTRFQYEEIQDQEDKGSLYMCPSFLSH